jgi:hypothetical protein
MIEKNKAPQNERLYNPNRTFHELLLSELDLLWQIDTTVLG